MKLRSTFSLLCVITSGLSLMSQVTADTGRSQPPTPEEIVERCGVEVYWSSQRSILEKQLFDGFAKPIETHSDETIARVRTLVEAGAPKTIDWGTPRILKVHSLTGFDFNGNFPRLVLDLVVGADGLSRLFVSPGPNRDDDDLSRVIEHYVIGKEHLESQASLQTKAAPVVRIIAELDNRGAIHVLWAEDQYFDPKYHPDELYLRSFVDGSWTAAERVTDDSAELFASTRSSVDLIVRDSTMIDVLWTDYREDHFLISLFTGEGQFSKSFHRRRGSSQWTPIRKIQKRGKFDVNNIAATTMGGYPHLFWSKLSRKRAELIHSEYLDGRWKHDRPIGSHPHLPGDLTFVLDVAVETCSPEAVFVAWIVTTESYEHELHYRTWSNGQWSEGGVTTTTAQEALLACDEGVVVVVLQECVDDRGNFDPEDCTLGYIPIQGRGSPQLIPIAENTQSGLIDVANDLNGPPRMVYVEASADGEVALKYLEATRQTDD